VTALLEAIVDVYRQVSAPTWAAANLDALADVLRDLSWLPVGPVAVSVPGGMADGDATRLREVLADIARETTGRARPVRVTTDR
jgi:hypothetical protein